jgi:hypothetical protein
MDPAVLGGPIAVNAEYGNWRGSVDLAMPLISGNQTYKGCMTGACDSLWKTQILKLKEAWEHTSRSGTLYLRLSWEMNGNWFPHMVKGTTANAFAEAWKRFDKLRDKYFPAMKLVFCTSAETWGANNLDWRKAVPGYKQGANQVAQYVDVIATDFYNQWWAKSTTHGEFTSKLISTDPKGAPRGLESYRQFAQSVGLPFAISEWGAVASGELSGGDAPTFVRAMRNWVAANAGSGPGKVLYEIRFNVLAQNGGKFVLGPGSQMPRSSLAYERAF